MAKAKQKRDSGKLYSEEELKCIRDYMETNGEFHDYETANVYAPYHFKKQAKNAQAMHYICVHGGL